MVPLFNNTLKLQSNQLYSILIWVHLTCYKLAKIEIKSNNIL